MKIKQLGLVSYETALALMQKFNNERTEDTEDEIWLCEHFPVYTLGLQSPIPETSMMDNIPVLKTDRGGKITYHGRGQLIVYFLVDLKRSKSGPAQFVKNIETDVIKLLGKFGVNGHLRVNMPGVYVNNAKIASLGLRIRRGTTYHGLALNVCMDLSPFSKIDPCGYQALQMIGIDAFIRDISIEQVISTILQNSDIFQTAHLQHCRV